MNWKALVLCETSCREKVWGAGHFSQITCLSASSNRKQLASGRPSHASRWSSQALGSFDRDVICFFAVAGSEPEIIDEPQLRHRGMSEKGLSYGPFTSIRLKGC
jgi:hypothetical protein